MSRGPIGVGGPIVSGKGVRRRGLARIRRLAVYAGPYRWRLIGAIAAMFGVLGCTLSLPLLMKSAIDSAIIPRDTHLLVIIGGIVISTHGHRIDASIASQLESARLVLSTAPTGGEA